MDTIDSPKYRNANIYWDFRIPTNPPSIDPKAETMLELWKEKDAILELIFPIMDKQFPHLDG